MEGRNVSVELNTRNFNQVAKPSLDEFCANSSVFHAGKTPNGI